jgi:hypothetical protein
MNIPDHLSEKQFLGIKILKIFYAHPDPGSGIFLTLDPRSVMEKFGSGMLLVTMFLLSEFVIQKLCDAKNNLGSYSGYAKLSGKE